MKDGQSMWKLVGYDDRSQVHNQDQCRATNNESNDMKKNKALGPCNYYITIEEKMWFSHRSDKIIILNFIHNWIYSWWPLEIYFHSAAMKPNAKDCEDQRIS